jgi:hypothetical protein
MVMLCRCVGEDDIGLDTKRPGDAARQVVRELGGPDDEDDHGNLA